MTAVRRITDLEVLKGLAHPVRQRLYRLLGRIGPATNTMLARELGDADPGLISYHLRELARHGFVEDVPDMGRDRRERWWRLVPGTMTWSELDFTAPGMRDAVDWIKKSTIGAEFEQLARFERSRDSWSARWQQAATNSKSYLYLAPEELDALCEEVEGVLRRWAEHGRQLRQRPDVNGVAVESGRRPVLLFLHAFPDGSP
jgi:DNA-binding transcriptional ArsR family regulator